MDISIGNRSESSGRFNFVVGEDGDVQFDDTEAHSVFTSSLEQRGTYPFDGTHGSDLHKLRSVTARTPSQASAMIRDGLDPLLRASLIAKVEVEAKVERVTPNRLSAVVKWTTPGGTESFASVEV